MARDYSLLSFAWLSVSIVLLLLQVVVRAAKFAHLAFRGRAALALWRPNGRAGLCPCFVAEPMASFAFLVVMVFFAGEFLRLGLSFHFWFFMRKIL